MLQDGVECSAKRYSPEPRVGQVPEAYDVRARSDDQKEVLIAELRRLVEESRRLIEAGRHIARQHEDVMRQYQQVWNKLQDIKKAERSES